MKKIIFAIIACLSVCFCVGFYQNGYFGIETEKISGQLPDYTIEEWAERSDLIVHGTIVDVSDPYEIESVAGERSIFTDYMIEPQTVLRGNTKEDMITLRMHGGRLGRKETIVEDNPDISVGDEAVFFLWQPNMGGGFNTAGNDYYYLRGFQVYFKTDDPTYFETDRGVGLDLDAFPQQLATIEDINPNRHKENSLKAMQQNVEEDMLTQKEYDIMVKSMNAYAHVVE